MKDPIRHLKHTQKKVVQAVRKTEKSPGLVTASRDINSTKKK
jgi:hypothetical protein